MPRSLRKQHEVARDIRDIVTALFGPEVSNDRVGPRYVLEDALRSMQPVEVSRLRHRVALHVRRTGGVPETWKDGILRER